MEELIFETLDDAWDSPTCKHLERRFVVALNAGEVNDDTFIYDGVEILQFIQANVTIGNISTILKILV